MYFNILISVFISNCFINNFNDINIVLLLTFLMF